jgi:hypothetical protein
MVRSIRLPPPLTRPGLHRSREKQLDGQAKTLTLRRVAFCMARPGATWLLHRRGNLEADSMRRRCLSGGRSMVTFRSVKASLGANFDGARL